MISSTAYYYALNNHTKPGFDLDYYQKIACKEPYWAYWFALYVPGADIEYCQKYACKSSYVAVMFAMGILDADIEYCRESCRGDSYSLDKINKFVISKAMA